MRRVTCFSWASISLIKPRIKTTKLGLLVFSPACKKLWNCHSVLTTRKIWANYKINTSSQIGRRREATGKTGETNRQMQGVTIYQSRGPQAEPPRKPVLRWETWTVTDELLEVQCGQIWKLNVSGEPSFQGIPTLFVSFPPWTFAWFS